ncbi:MAG: rhodanese-like domain-containing protein [Terracidiphilus sp.]
MTGPMDYEISPAEAAQALRQEGARLIDVRETWEYSVTHVEGSLHMPMGEVPNRAHAELNTGQRLIVLCHHGVRSLRVTAWLRKQGFDKAQSLAGGIEAWSLEVDPELPRY